MDISINTIRTFYPTTLTVRYSQCASGATEVTNGSVDCIQGRHYLIVISSSLHPSFEVAASQAGRSALASDQTWTRRRRQRQKRAANKSWPDVWDCNWCSLRLPTSS